MIGSLIVWLFIIGNAFSVESVGATPKHVHISLNNDPQSMVVTWTTFAELSPGVQSFVNFGTQYDSLTTKTSASYTVFPYHGINRYIYKTVLTNLQYSTRYYYSVGSSDGMSQVFSFKTFPQGSDYKLNICIFGDLGVFNGQSVAPLIAAGQNNDFDMIIHLGDLAYDLHSEDGNVGDTFMDEMEPLIATKPYMVIAGNHEFDWRATNFANYEKRFNMPLDGDQKNQYYSFNAGPISFVGISSEFYGFFYDFGIQPVLDQYSYLEKKFQSINADRGDHPWLITFHHRPFYCSNADSTECDAFENRVIRDGYLNMPGLEALYYKYGVDMNWSGKCIFHVINPFFIGHEHSYERLFPVYNRKLLKKNGDDAYHNALATTYIIDGAAGCHSFISKVGKLSPFSAKTVSDYGYAIMHVKSKNELYIEQISSSAGYENRQVVDSYTMSKDPNYILGQSELKPEQYTDFAIEYKEVPKFIRSICVGRDIRCRDIFQKVSAMKYKKYYVEDNTYEYHGESL